MAAAALNTNTYTLEGATAEVRIRAKGHRTIRLWVDGDFGGGTVAVGFGSDPDAVAQVESYSAAGGVVLDPPEGWIVVSLTGATEADLKLTVSTTLS